MIIIIIIGGENDCGVAELPPPHLWLTSFAPQSNCGGVGILFYSNKN